jgi:hypothetical protein
VVHNSIGNIPRQHDLVRVLGNEEPFNVSFDRTPLVSASLWGRPGPANPYADNSRISRACLLDSDRETLADAAYVIFGSGTPIAWKLRDGRWMVPACQYSDLTNQQTVTVLAALFTLDVRDENCNLLQP